MKDRRETKRATAVQIVQVSRLLDEHFDKSRSAYREGWDDLRVASESGAPFKSVVSVRTQLYGKLIGPGKPDKYSDRFQRLEDCYVRLQARVHRLEAELGVKNNDNANG